MMTHIHTFKKITHVYIYTHIHMCIYIHIYIYAYTYIIPQNEVLIQNRHADFLRSLLQKSPTKRRLFCKKDPIVATPQPTPHSEVCIKTVIHIWNTHSHLFFAHMLVTLTLKLSRILSRTLAHLTGVRVGDPALPQRNAGDARFVFQHL